MPAPKVLIVADLHLDVWKRSGRDPFEAVPAAVWAGLDAVIVAGDLSNEACRKWPRHLARLAALVGGERVYVLPGNHDYYGLRFGDDAVLAGLCREAGVQFAQKRVLTFGNWRFLCATLWTDQALAGRAALVHSADFRRILPVSGEGSLAPEDWRAVHLDHLNWLEANLSTPWPGETYVVTHHAPHPVALAKTDRAAGFASDLSALMERHPPAGWFFGHVHRRCEVMLGQTALRNVSFGTPAEVAPGDEGVALLRGLI